MEILLIGGGILLATWVVASLATKKKRRRAPRELGLPLLTPWGTTVPEPLPAAPVPAPAPEVVRAVQDARSGSGSSASLAVAAQTAANQGMPQTAAALHVAATARAESEGSPPPPPLPSIMIEWEARVYTTVEFEAYLRGLQPSDVFGRENGGLSFLAALGERLRTIPGLTEDHPIATAAFDMVLRYVSALEAARVQAMPEAGLPFLEALGRLLSEVGVNEAHPIAQAYRTLVSQWLDLIGTRLQVIAALSDADLARIVLVARGMNLGSHGTAAYIESIIQARQQGAASMAPDAPEAPAPAEPGPRTWEWSRNPGERRTAEQWRQVFDLFVERNAWAGLQALEDAPLAELLLIARESGAADHAVATWIESVLLARSREREAPAAPVSAPSAPVVGPTGYDPARARELAPVLDRELRRLGTGDRNTRSRRQTGATLSALESFSRAAFGDTRTQAEIDRNGRVSYGGGMRGALVHYGISNPPQPLVAPLTTQTYAPPTGAVA